MIPINSLRELIGIIRVAVFMIKIGYQSRQWKALQAKGVFFFFFLVQDVLASFVPV